MSFRLPSQTVQRRAKGAADDAPAIAPGRKTKTNRQAPAAGSAVQRRAAPGATKGAPPPAEVWSQHPDMLAAHGHIGAVQAKGAPAEDAESVRQAAAQGVSGSGSSLPYADRIQSSFGRHDISGVRAHQGAGTAAAARSIGAAAYATGSDVAFGSQPDIHTAAHEAAHVVQQRAGVSLAGGVGQVGDRYEQHADRVADAVVRGDSAEGLLDEMTGGGAEGAVQRRADEVQRSEDDDAEQSARQAEAVRQLEGIQGFDDGFYNTAGAVLESIVPRAGDKAKVEFRVNLPIHNTGATRATLGLAFVCEAENDGTNFKAKCEAGVTGVVNVDLFIAEAFVEAKGFGYIESVGDSGAEVFRFMSYGLYENVARVSRRAADAVWHEGLGASVARDMQGDDYVETGLGAEVNAGLSADGGDIAASTGLRATRATRYSNGGRDQERYNMIAGRLGFTFAPWTGEMAWQVSERNGGEVELTARGERFVKVSDFQGEINNGNLFEVMRQWIAGCITSISSLVSGSISADSPSHQRAMGALRSAGELSMGLNLAAGGGIAALNEHLGKAGLPIDGGFGQQLVIKVTGSGNQGALQVSLERVGRVEIGNNPRDPVYGMLENMSRMLWTPPVMFPLS